MKWVEANRAALRYELLGHSGPLVVLLHEAGGSLESWDAVVANLAAQCRILRYDQRGFGMSEGTRSLSLPQMVSDLIALLDVLDVQVPCHLVGTAIGGSIALAAAALHPNRVAGVLVTSPVTGGLSPSAQTGLLARAASVESGGMRAVTDTSLQRSWPPELRTDLDIFEEYRARYLTNDPISFAALTRSFIQIRLEHLYPHIQCPTIVVGSSRDLLKPTSECVALSDKLPRGRYVELDSGHFVALQAPHLLAHLLREFLETVDVRV